MATMTRAVKVTDTCHVVLRGPLVLLALNAEGNDPAQIAPKDVLALRQALKGLEAWRDSDSEALCGAG